MCKCRMKEIFFVEKLPEATASLLSLCELFLTFTVLSASIRESLLLHTPETPCVKPWR